MFRQATPPQPPAPLSRALEAELKSLDRLPPEGLGEADSEEARLSALYRSIHSSQRPLTALCISGGGIRSATFALGAIQELARKGLLSGFDYLSTVSGGGYIGSWLSAWIHRDGSAEKVADRLSHSDLGLPERPQSDPVQHLREYNNYLTPRLGIASPDTWTLISIISRNLFLNWLLFVPLLLIVVMMPRVMVSLLQVRPPGGQDPFFGFHLVEQFMLIMSILLYWIASFNTFRFLPSVGSRPNTQTQFVNGILLPVILCGTLLILDFWWLRDDLDLKGWHPDYFSLAIATLGIVGSSWLIYLWRVEGRRGGAFLDRLLGPLSVAVILTGLSTGAAIYALTKGILSGTDSDEGVFAYATFGPPLLLIGVILGGVAFVGFTSRALTDEDREWFSRSAAFTLMFLSGWLILCWLVLVAPHLFFHAAGWIQTSIASIGGLSGLLTALAGRSGKSGGSDKDSPSLASKGVEIAARLALPVFLVLLIVGLSLLVNLLFVKAGLVTPAWHSHGDVLRTTPLWAAVGFILLLAAFAWVMGRFVNINRFSLHAMYHHRLVRAYLAASNFNRKPNAFTGFDPSDNIAMHELRGQRPLPVLNLALNLVGGRRLAWQQRKAETFTVTPWHSGSLDLGYRDSKEYGGSVTLGTAMTISGAAASPNMGYHSSPLISFTMMLFNARLGAWLGNPGVAGNASWREEGPRSAVGSMIREALGLTDDQGEYVYLSDGGHFENLALYEMIVRRCNTVLLLDNGCDPDYNYEDLGNALRKIRIDLEVPIYFPEAQLRPLLERRRRWAVATIQYSAVDPGAPDGRLIYLKPMVMDHESPDVLSYKAASPTFPHETTGDQWFSEAQTESYRTLGEYSIREMCYGFSGDSLADLATQLAGTDATIVAP